jgi:hypothetical protein
MYPISARPYIPASIGIPSEFELVVERMTSLSRCLAQGQSDECYFRGLGIANRSLRTAAFR